MKAFPLRPLRNEDEHDRALVVLRKLAVREEKALSEGETDYLEALTRFVEDYEEEHHQSNCLARTKGAIILRPLP
ncbi:MAG: hypothetical protein HY721_13550 [Planctomycetes bacterium]|nr:hypothetical protein [Planctomycetota bacterium]